MNCEKEISVIIPAYNAERTIKRALESIKNQTALSKILEVIIINDGSTDKTKDIITTYQMENPEMNICVINQENGGVSKARNAGLKVARGKYIALLDSDDEWDPQKTEVQMQVLKENPNIDFLGCNVDDIELKILWKKINTLYKASIKDYCIKNFPATPTIIFKKSIIKKVGYFDETQAYAEDGNYYLKICKNFNYYHLPVSLVKLGCGKPSFGYSGLSANLKGMYLGNVKNLKELKKNKDITFLFYKLMRIFYVLKYFRRILITKMRKK